MSREGFEQLRAAVHDDPDLARRLHELDPEQFAAAVVHVSAERGFDVAGGDVEAAIWEGRRAWGLRWVE